MTVKELKIEAKKSKNAGYLDEALELYTKLWELEKNEWNGYFLAQCLRKKAKYDEARQLHNELEKSYSNFKPLQNDKLWLDYSEKIKNWDNPNIITDAESILARSDKYDKYTSSVYTKTVLKVISKLLYSDHDNKQAYKWLLKLDQSVIDSSVSNFNGKAYPADRKVFFIRYAMILINLEEHINYIEKCLTSLNFSDKKRTEFKKQILENITFESGLSRRNLAINIKNFQEEFHLRLRKETKSIYNPKKITLISDLSHFLFCPISFAINETFKIESNSSWEKDEWLGDKKLFIDRHKLYKRSNSFDLSFKESDIIIDDKLISDFSYLFNSKITVNNATNPKPTIYTNHNNSLRGAPDYVMEDINGVKYAVTEKFSSQYSADYNQPFESDLVKHYAFISELQKINISFGYFITWYWHFVDIETNNDNIKKKMVISSYRLTKIERNQSNDKILSKVISDVEIFKQNKSMEIDGERISFAKKCLNCSVFSYCNHKTGKYNIIKLPYDLISNHVLDEPIIEFEPEPEPIIEVIKEERKDEDTNHDLPY